jgi:hypothetical protein
MTNLSVARKFVPGGRKQATHGADHQPNCEKDSKNQGCRQGTRQIGVTCREPSESDGQHIFAKA